MKKSSREYYELLLKRCVNVKDSLFISANKVCTKYIKELKKVATSLGVTDIYLNIRDDRKYKKVLRETKIEDIKTHPFFSGDKWNKYADKNASFLIFNTEVPGCFDGIDKTKLVESAKAVRRNKGRFNKKQRLDQINNCFAVLPNKIWAKNLFPKEKHAEEKLFNLIKQTCMVDGSGTAIEKWNDYIEKCYSFACRLNDLKIHKLIYKSNGTNLEVELIPNSKFLCILKDFVPNLIVNMPSYEVFISPNAYKINGTISATKPFLCKDVLIENMRLELKDGKIISATASSGEKELQELIFNTPGADRLGEAALVSLDSPIAKTNITFGTTLLDENASCHFALGNGFVTCLKDYQNKTSEEIQKLGCNQSLIHEDFMISDESLNVFAKTKTKTIQIIKNGIIVF